MCRHLAIALEMNLLTDAVYRDTPPQLSLHFAIFEFRQLLVSVQLISQPGVFQQRPEAET